MDDIELRVSEFFTFDILYLKIANLVVILQHELDVKGFLSELTLLFVHILVADSGK